MGAMTAYATVHGLTRSGLQPAVRPPCTKIGLPLTTPAAQRLAERCSSRWFGHASAASSRKNLSRWSSRRSPCVFVMVFLHPAHHHRRRRVPAGHAARGQAARRAHRGRARPDGRDSRREAWSAGSGAGRSRRRAHRRRCQLHPGPAALRTRQGHTADKRRGFSSTLLAHTVPSRRRCATVGAERRWIGSRYALSSIRFWPH